MTYPHHAADHTQCESDQPPVPRPSHNPIYAAQRLKDEAIAKQVQSLYEDLLRTLGNAGTPRDAPHRLEQLRQALSCIEDKLLRAKVYRRVIEAALQPL